MGAPLLIDTGLELPGEGALRVAADVRLPVCALMPYKPILEWVIYCLTAIGAWRIGYSALRQEDSKAAKGGF